MNPPAIKTRAGRTTLFALAIEHWFGSADANGSGKLHAPGEARAVPTLYLASRLFEEVAILARLSVAPDLRAQAERSHKRSAAWTHAVAVASLAFAIGERAEEARKAALGSALKHFDGEPGTAVAAVAGTAPADEPRT